MADFAFSKELFTISNNLTASDVTNLKFLCGDLLPRRVVEEVSTGADLFSALRGRDYISRDKLDFLEELLGSVSKAHLLRSLREAADPSSRAMAASPRPPSPPASMQSSLKFSQFLVSVGDELPQRDLKNVAYFFQSYKVTGLSAQEVQSLREPSKLFAILKQEKIISPTNVEKLRTVMDAIGRKDICEKIGEYARSVPGYGVRGGGGGGGGGGGQGQRAQGARGRSVVMPGVGRMPAGVGPGGMGAGVGGMGAGGGGMPGGMGAAGGIPGFGGGGRPGGMGFGGGGMPGGMGAHQWGSRGVQSPGWDGGRGGGGGGGRESEEQAASRRKLGQLPSMDSSSMSGDSLYSFDEGRDLMHPPPPPPSHGPGPKTGNRDFVRQENGMPVAEESEDSDARRAFLYGRNVRHEVPTQPARERSRGEESMESAAESITHGGAGEMAGIHPPRRGRGRTHTQLLQQQYVDKVHQLQMQLEHERAHNLALADQRQQQQQQQHQQSSNGELERELERKGHEVHDLRQEVEVLRKQLLAGDDSEMYPMNIHPPHGKAIVIVNDTFTPNPDDPSIKLLPRPGAEHDMFLLKSTFEHLQYEVDCYTNLTCEEMYQVFYRAVKESHEENDSFICCISSHGDENVIYGTDSVGAKRFELIQIMKQSESLRGKPKLFFLQACRTKSSSAVGGARLMCLLPEVYLPEAAEQDADVYVANASTVNYASYRDHERGSWFVMALHHIFTRHGDRLLTLDQMMHKVNSLVCTAQGVIEDDDPGNEGTVQREARQCAETTSSFRMGLRFRFDSQ